MAGAAVVAGADVVVGAEVVVGADDAAEARADAAGDMDNVACFVSFSRFSMKSDAKPSLFVLLLVLFAGMIGLGALVQIYTQWTHPMESYRNPPIDLNAEGAILGELNELHLLPRLGASQLDPRKNTIFP